MRRLPLIFLLLSGCLSNNSLDTMTLAADNITNLSRISVGMSEAEVLQIMHKPYSKETIQYEGDAFDFWFYVTRPSGLDQDRLLSQNLTPLTFKNGVLIGWGFNYYNHLVKQEKLGANKKPKTPPAEEDVNLEKALQSSPSSKKPSETPPPRQGPQPLEQNLAPEKKGPPASPPAKQGANQPQPGMQPPQTKPLEIGPPSQTPKQSTSLFKSHELRQLIAKRFLAQSDQEQTDTPSTQKSSEREKQAKQEGESENQKRHPDEKDQHMIEQDNENNFDFW